MRFSVAHHVHLEIKIGIHDFWRRRGEEGGEEASRTEVEGTLRQERDVLV
jgi:hypothetical protein